MNYEMKSKMVPAGSAGMRAAARPMVMRPVGKKKSSKRKAKKLADMTPLELSKQKKMISKPMTGRFMTGALGGAMGGMKGAAGVQFPIRDSAQKAFSRNNF